MTDQSVLCPVCGLHNDPDAVFCANHACHKALGELPYDMERFAASATRLERLAERVSRFTANPHFVTLHVVWFAGWILLNTGALTGVSAFDAYPFGLLGILLAIEAILITGFLLISQTRQSRYAETRAEVEYEINVRAYRLLLELERRLDARPETASVAADTGRQAPMSSRTPSRS
jgi:uncharacterized membrane protein